MIFSQLYPLYYLYVSEFLKKKIIIIKQYFQSSNGGRRFFKTIKICNTRVYEIITCKHIDRKNTET